MKLHSLENDPEYIQLQTEFVWLQEHIHENDDRLLIIFEGRDTAGKGGGIMRFVRYLNPRWYEIVALSKPTEKEAKQWFFQKYIKRLPDPGVISFFDRSWYNRAVVEPVMGFCTQEQHERFMKEVVEIEQILVEDGMKIIKLWFSIKVEEQKRRLDERKQNPLLNWKMSTVDAVAQRNWKDYTKYKQKMYRLTSKAHCPWVVINGNDKDVGRKEALRYVVSQFDYPRKGESGVSFELNDEFIAVLKSKEDADNFISMYSGY